MNRRLFTLPGYDARIEKRLRFYKRRFDVADNNADRREAFRKLASVTALRSPAFISALERELGIHLEERRRFFKRHFERNG